MTNLLLLGVGPLATDPNAASGPHFRTTLFWQALSALDATIHLASLGAEDADGRSEEQLPGGGKMVTFSPQAMLQVEPVRQWAAHLNPTAIIGCGTVLPAAAAARLRDLAPVWIDLAGDPVAEVQSKAEAYPDDPHEELLHHVWKLTVTCLRNADRFSGVSRAQVHSLVGMLSLLGRLNAQNAGEPLVFRLPNGACPRLHEKDSQATPRVFRGIACPEDAFLVAWSGSYNTWVDEDLLYNGLIEAMNQSPRIHYVSTGGGAAGYNEGIYERFQQRIKSGPHQERFHLLGWLRRDEAEAVHRECNVGLNIDRWCYEGVLGARNRIVSFLDLGLPVATTVLAEISEDLVKAGGAFAIPFADPGAMAELLVGLAQRPFRLQESVERGRAWLRENDFLSCAAPLQEWAASPSRSGDFRADGGYANIVNELTDFEAVERTLASLHGNVQNSPLQKIAGRLRQIRGKFS